MKNIDTKRKRSVRKVRGRAKVKHPKPPTILVRYSKPSTRQSKNSLIANRPAPPHYDSKFLNNFKGKLSASQLFIKNLMNPGTSVAPSFDDAHQTPYGAAIASGNWNQTHTNANYAVITLRTAASTLYNPSAGGGVLLPWHYADVASASSTITQGYLDANQAGASWDSIYGSTSAASRVMPWATKVNICINAPPSVIQGQIWIGNMPYQQYFGRSITELIRNCQHTKSGSHLAFDVSNTIVELGNIHSKRTTLPAAAATVSDFDESERVTYVIIGPSQVGSIGGGSAPTQYTINMVGVSNYSWVPVYNPIVSKVVEETVANNLKEFTNAGARAEINETVEQTGISSLPIGSIAVKFDTSGQGRIETGLKKLGSAPSGHGRLEEAEQEDVRRRRLQETYDPSNYKFGSYYGPTQPGRSALMKYHKSSPFLPDVDLHPYLDPLAERKCYDMYIGDLTYFDAIMRSRWDQIWNDDNFGTRAQELKNQIDDLIKALQEWEEGTRNILEVFPAYNNKIVYQDGKYHVLRFDECGKPWKNNPILPELNLPRRSALYEEEEQSRTHSSERSFTTLRKVGK